VLGHFETDDEVESPIQLMDVSRAGSSCDSRSWKSTARSVDTENRTRRIPKAVIRSNAASTSQPTGPQHVHDDRRHDSGGARPLLALLCEERAP
jgi:hypothetical protein